MVANMRDGVSTHTYTVKPDLSADTRQANANEGIAPRAERADQTAAAGAVHGGAPPSPDGACRLL